MTQPVSIFWFRRDLRLSDNAGLYHALKGKYPVLPLFIFDKDILDTLPDREDGRVSFIFDAVQELKTALEANGSTLLIKTGRPEVVWTEIMQEYKVKSVFTNRDYEPTAIARDQAVALLLEQQGVSFHTFKDHVIFEQKEILTDGATPYTVFTPYSRKWLATLESRMQPDPVTGEASSFYLAAYPTEKYFNRFLRCAPKGMPTLEDIGFERTSLTFPPAVITQKVIRYYGDNRDFPARNGTSKLGVHFRFGTISIREKARHALSLSKVYLNELIWRDFYSQILANFPHVATRAFKPAYDLIPWREAPADFERWCAGHTGYPIVDAGMRELAATGYMHNRVRMITASFLTKHLLIDWRLGEAWFAQKLLDFDLASNNGGWQWAAGCGTDAAPYFRIFNPEEQTKKFDPDYQYIRKWVPEFGTSRYVKPMVEHKFARERCLNTYQRALKN